MTTASAYTALDPISLEALNAVASLQTRVDRKYVVDSDTVDAMVLAHADTTRVLSIDGRRGFDYRSIYFDTPDLDAFTSAARRRRRRWKVRTRTYANTGDCMLEVKTKGARGVTVKSRIGHDADAAARLTRDARRFVQEATAGTCATSELVPTLATSYRRTTMVDVEAGSRLTVDHDLACTDWGHHRATIGDLLIVETKSAGRPSPADRWLWAHGIRPTRVSKFCTGLAALHPELPNNAWHRTLVRDWVVD